MQLGDITEPKVDQSGPPRGGEFVYVDITSVDNKSKRIVEPKRLPVEGAPSRARQRLRAGDVLVSMTRPNLNAVALVPPELDGAVGSTGFHVLRAGANALPQWLYYGVQTQQFVGAMSELVQGALYPAVRPKEIRAFDMPVPHIDEQRRIVAEIEKQFSRLDEAVANLKRVKANLGRFRAGVYQAAVEGSLFARADEEQARRDPAKESAESLLGRVRDIHRSTWSGRGKYRVPEDPSVDSLPRLPAGWVWTTWGQIGHSQNGRPFPSSEYADHGVRLLRPGNMHQSGTLVWDDNNTRYLPTRYETADADLIVEGGELVMNLTAQSLKDEFLGRVCLTAPGERCLLNQRLARLTPCGFPASYALVVFKSRLFRAFVDGLNTGSLIQHMFTSQLERFPFPLPPLEVQQRIVAEVDRRLSIVREVEVEVDANLKRAQVLRQAVLVRAFGVVQ